MYYHLSVPNGYNQTVELSLCCRRNGCGAQRKKKMLEYDCEVSYKNNKGHTVKVYQDENPQSPRDNDNLGSMTFFHNRYNLGDKHNHTPESFNEFLEYNSDGIVAVKVYGYEHGQLTISTKPFSCIFDSGVLGYIHVSKLDAMKAFEQKEWTKELEDKIVKCLEQEVETYDQYLVGDVYGYIVFDEDDEEIDSCWGFYGSDINKNGIKDYADNI